MTHKEALTRITRDDTEHGKEYYLASDVDALLAQPEPIQHCKACHEYCWKCNEEIKPTYGSEEIRKLREVNKSLNDHIVDINKKVEPPPWWPAIENILNEYGLQAIDFVADFKEALAQPEQCKPLTLTDEQADKILETAEKVAPKYAGWVCDQRRAYVRAGYNAANGIKGDA